MQIRRRACLAGVGALVLAGCGAGGDAQSDDTAEDAESQVDTDADGAAEDDGDSDEESSEPEAPRSEVVDGTLALTEEVEFSSTPVAIHNFADDRMAVDRMIELQPPFTLEDMIDFSAFTVTVEMFEGEQREVASVEELVEVVDTTESSSGGRDATGVRLNDSEEPYYGLKLFALDKELDGLSFAEGFIAPLHFFSFIPDNNFEHFSEPGFPKALLTALGAPTRAWYKSADTGGSMPEEHICVTYERDDYFIGLYTPLYTDEAGETSMGATHDFEYGSIKALDAWVEERRFWDLEQII